MPAAEIPTRPPPSHTNRSLLRKGRPFIMRARLCPCVLCKDKTGILTSPPRAKDRRGDPLNPSQSKAGASSCASATPTEETRTVR